MLYLRVAFIADNTVLQYQGTARQGESRKGLEGKPKNPYASLKAAKRGQTSKIAVGSSILYPLQAMIYKERGRC